MDDNQKVEQEKLQPKNIPAQNSIDTASIIPMGGVGDVTRNMYLYEYHDEILIVDCGIGFADQSMPGVDLMIPDVSYLKSTNKKIVGMVLTHGHEDHIGATPFVLPELPEFPVYGSSLTIEFVREKLKEYGVNRNLNPVNLDETVKLGNFKVSFARVTHSIVDATNLFIQTPAGNFYHGSDFKFDWTPADGKLTELSKITRFGDQGILCTLEDSLGSERPGYTPSEHKILESFEEEFARAKGKIFMSTYSSNISRLNQAIEVGVKMRKKFCFMGRSLLKTKEVGLGLGYMKFPGHMEIKPHEIKKFKPNEVVIMLAGSQAQEFSALVRVAYDQDRDIKIQKGDTVIFSADPIPGNELNVNALVDTISKKGARVRYSGITHEFHVSGHGSQEDIKLMIALTRPKLLMPIGGTYKQMVAYRDIAKTMGYSDRDVVLGESGLEIIFSKEGFRFGRRIKIENVYLDAVSGEPVENYVIIDRKKISKEGIVTIIAEIDSQTGQLVATPDVLTRGFTYEGIDEFAKRLQQGIAKKLGARREKVNNWTFVKSIVGKTAEEMFFREKREPLVVPVVLEV
jgi:ribonuclease J